MGVVPGERADRGVHLVGSIPLPTVDDVFAQLSASLGDRLERLPDGETGPRADWIVWQYPVLSSCDAFEVCPPGAHPYRSMPRLRLRPGASAQDVVLANLGYADAAVASYRAFARAKRAGTVPEHCRFQVCLPTPLSPVTAFIATEDQAAIEPIYEAAMAGELARILANIAHDQLAIQWDANFEFAMLSGLMPCWFDDVRGGIVDRLARAAALIPDGVELGFHFCHDHHRLRHDRPYDARGMVEIANALATRLRRPLNWLHLPVPGGRLDVNFFEKLAPLALGPETELYLGLIHLSEGALGATARITAARRYVRNFGVATECGWGRYRAKDLDALSNLHADASTPTHAAWSQSERFHWSDGFDRVPAELWTQEPGDDAARAYDVVDRHRWYGNLDETVTTLAGLVRDGTVVVDYSGGTGILIDRLKLRALGVGFGSIIVDTSPSYLRVAIEKFRSDPSVAVRLVRRLRDEGRMQTLSEVLGPLASAGVDIIACTNAIHLYPDLAATLRSWRNVLRDGGHVVINSGSIRNPSASASQWIPDETVWSLADIAEGLVRSDSRFGVYRACLDDQLRLKAHAAVRDRAFPPARPLERYVDALATAGFTVIDVSEATISTDLDDWFEYLSHDHGTVLGWVGGTAEVDGAEPSPDAVADRIALLRRSIDVLFGGRTTFDACWTYITATTTTVPTPNTSTHVD